MCYTELSCSLKKKKRILNYNGEFGVFSTSASIHNCSTLFKSVYYQHKCNLPGDQQVEYRKQTHMEEYGH